MRKIHLSWKDLFFNLALALLYFGVAKMGLLFGFSKEPILSHWSSSGLALAALLIWGYRLAPAVFLGALATYLSAGVPWGSALLIGVGETLEAVIAFYCLRRTRFDRRMPRLRDLWLLIAFGVLLGPLIATTVSVTAFALSGLTLPASSSVWWTWWLGDAGSVLVLTPPLLMMVVNQRWTRGERIETAGVLLFLLASSVLVFWDPFPKIIPLVSGGYLVFPALLYSGLRTGMYGAALSVFLLSISAATATALGLGPIARYEPDLNLWQLDIYMWVAAITAYGFALVVNERRQMEENLKESEQRYRSMLDNMLEGVQVIGFDWRYIYINNIAAQQGKKPKEELFGRTVMECYPGIESTPLFAALQRCMTECTALQMENEFVYPDGRQGWLDLSIQPVPEGLLILSQDITFRKRAEEALQRNETLLLQTGKMAKVGGWELDLQTMTLTWSSETYRIHEVDPSFKPNLENAINFYAPEARPIITEAVRQAMEEGKAYDLELPFITAKGNRIWVRAMGEAEFQNGKCVRLFGTFQDITERKRLEEERLAREVAERANRAKSEFLSRMSHELRTPLNSILGFAQLLEMDKLNPDQSQNVHQILKSGRHLLDLVNEVLDIARIEAGHITIFPEPVHVETAVQEALDIIRPLADQRGISIQVKVPSSQDVFITADPQRLKQVLLNLLSNAVKFNRLGGEIHITASLLVDDFLHLAVGDTGEGIPPDKMDRLFIPFERLELDPQRAEGTGLGLALSKRLVEAMGGRMGAQSVFGEGSTFWFDLPLTSKQKKVVLMAEVDDYLKATPSTGKGLILYVEDNLSNVKLVEKIIARLPGVELLTAMQGRLTLDLARANHPNLILLDIHLPDIDGGEVLRALRADPQTADIPVVVMSADATHAQIERMLAAGANAYLTKPIDVRQFLDVVGRILDG